ncbi:MAG TPA: peptide ABC transporter permease [Deltaproteobacteria bacterium]|nr:peptide ABC transporter permease [Deltaproteobacteria bacterium]|tara:strand:- start:2367 stop:3500 length:1134 start_codon:yes stop_codon:yes gene_type:complete
MTSQITLSNEVNENMKDEAFDIAPNWKLVWWRFKKHRLALVSVFVLLVIILIALFPDFFSIQDPNKSSARKSFMPPQGISFFHDGSLQVHVKPLKGKRNKTTLKMEWGVDEKRILPLRFFTSGYEYEVFGLFTTDLHLFSIEKPSARNFFHLLGTDRLGRDQWSRLMHGTRVSLSIGLVAVGLSILLGILLGGISGYYGGWPDLVIQRLIEILQSLPPIPIWMALTAALPRDWTVEQTYFAITIILSLLGWTTLGREVRGRFLSLREEDFVMAAKLSGCSQSRIIFRHMLPTFTSHIIATSTLAIPVMIINETFLSFLGLGLRPPAISWGVLLQEAQNLQSIALAPWLLLPGLAVIFTVLALNILGDGLRDAADPYS